MESISNVCYTNNQLLNFKINRRHNTFDIAKHLVGSLKKNCKSFKIKCCAIKSMCIMSFNKKPIATFK